MDFLTFSLADYTLFILMFGASIAVGIYYGFFAKQQRTTDSYLLGDKKMNILPVAMSLVASSISGISLLALPTEIYIHGTLYALTALDPLAVFFIVYFVFLPVFWKLQISTAFEYLEIRFSRGFRTFASILFMFVNIICLPIIIYAPSLAFNQVTGFNLHLTAVIMSSICIFYTTIGGLKAVVWTDSLQLAVTLSTLGFVFVMGTISEGGFETIWEKAQAGDRIEFFNLDPDPTIRNTFWTVFIGTSIGWMAYVAANPAMIQRFMAVPTLNDSRKVLVVFALFTVITKVICCFFGIIIFAKYFDCDPLSSGKIKKPDQILPYYVLDVAAEIPGLSGLFIAGLFSTALSTLSTFLNSLGGIIYKDFISSYMPTNTTEQTASNIMKLITLIVGIISVSLVFIVERLGTILELITTLGGATIGPLMGLFLLGIFFPFANRKGAATGVAVSLSFMLFFISKYQLHVWNGAIKHPTKPLYTYGCNTTTSLYSSTTIIPTNSQPLEELFWLYRLSFHYFTAMGTLLTLIVGLPISWFTNNKDLYVNPDALCPWVHAFIREYEPGDKKVPIFNFKDTYEKNHVQYQFSDKLNKQ